MIEALIALLLGILIVFVFAGPAFMLKLAVAGGVAFVCYVLILVVEWLFGKLKG